MADDRVLIVDDCRMTTLLLRYVLREAGIESETAGTAAEGLDKACRNEYRLIFLDIVLPDMDGLELTRTIRERRGDEAPPILLMTVLGEGFRPEAVSASGASGVLFKPIAPSEVTRAVREHLGEAAPRVS